MRNAGGKVCRAKRSDSMLVDIALKKPNTRHKKEKKKNGLPSTITRSHNAATDSTTEQKHHGGFKTS